MRLCIFMPWGHLIQKVHGVYGPTSTALERYFICRMGCRRQIHCAERWVRTRDAFVFELSIFFRSERLPIPDLKEAAFS